MSSWPIYSSSLAQLRPHEWIMVLFGEKSMLGIPDDEKTRFTIFTAVLLEQIWALRNLVVHKNHNINTLQWKYLELNLWWRNTLRPKPAGKKEKQGVYGLLLLLQAGLNVMLMLL